MAKIEGTKCDACGSTTMADHPSGWFHVTLVGVGYNVEHESDVCNECAERLTVGGLNRGEKVTR